MANAMSFTPQGQDPFQASGGGVWTGSQWVPKNHPLAQNVQGQSGQATGSATYPQTLSYVPGAAPAWQGPSDAIKPTWQTQTPFTYGAFQPPTADSVYADPSYQWRFDQGRQAAERGAAAKGVLHSGNTLAALTNYGQNLASTEYGNIFNRGLDTYRTNYGVAKDIYDAGRMERDAGYDAAVGAYGRDFTERTNAYKPQYDTWVAREAARSGNELGNFNRGWERETYANDDAYRRWRDELDNSYRWGTYNRDDAYRWDRAAQDDRRFLVTTGNY